MPQVEGLCYIAELLPIVFTIRIFPRPGISQRWPDNTGTSRGFAIINAIIVAAAAIIITVTAIIISKTLYILNITKNNCLVNGNMEYYVAYCICRPAYEDKPISVA